MINLQSVSINNMAVWKKMYSFILIILYTVVVITNTSQANTTNQLAWSENAGWINFNDSHQPMFIYEDHLEGYVWNEGVGWIRLGSRGLAGEYTYSNTSINDWGVNRNAEGILSGYAWAENAGWINFNSSFRQVSHDATSGVLTGYAWSESLGWISFNQTSHQPAYVISKPLNTPTEGVVLPAFACDDQDQNNEIIQVTVDTDTLRYIPSTVGTTRLPVIDLTTDIEAGTEGLLSFIRNSPGIAAQWSDIQSYEQDHNTGVLHVINANSQRASLRPVYAFQNTGALDWAFTDRSIAAIDHYTLAQTHNGRVIVFESSLLAEIRFQDLLLSNSLILKFSAEGDLHILNNTESCSSTADSHFYSVRPVVASNLVDEVVNDDNGELIELESNDSTEQLDYAHLIRFFTDENHIYQQNMYSTPADWDQLYDYLISLDNVSSVQLNGEGIISVVIDQLEYIGRMDAEVHPTQGGAPQELILESVGDLNNNNLNDYKVVYHNGQWQNLYLMDIRAREE